MGMSNVSRETGADSTMLGKMTPDTVIAMFKRRDVLAGIVFAAIGAFVGSQLWPYYAPVDANAALRFFEAVA